MGTAAAAGKIDSRAARRQRGAMLVHATCVAIDGHGILLRGPSGSGKSDLALRLIDAGARLVADDQAELSRDGAELVAAPAPALAGLMEVRGLGILRFDHLPRAVVRLAVDLVLPAACDRLPEPATLALLGIAVPLVAIAPFEASAAAKVRLAVRLATGDIIQTHG